MERSEPYRDEGRSAPADVADDRLRMIELARAEPWPDRDCCEVALVFRCGAEGLGLAARAEPLRVGHAALLPPGTDLIATCDVEVLCARLDGLPAPDAPRALHDALVAQLLRRAWSSRFSRTAIIEPTLRLVEALVALNVALDTDPDRARPDPMDPRIARVIDHIETHLAEPLTVACLAAVGCVSPAHFARMFKDATGESVWAFVQRRRCERAHEMLRHTSEPIARIAHECGFSDQSHLTTMIKRTYGRTPGVIRAEG